MNDVRGDKPKLRAIYAPGLTRWLKGAVKANLLIATLIAVFALSVLLFAGIDSVFAQSNLVYRIGTDVITAVLIATTVGLFYELIARSSMTTETVRIVKQELGSELDAIRQRGDRDCGLIGFGETHDYFHQNIVKHLPTAGCIKVMAIHGTRVWANSEIRRAVVDRPGVGLEALMLAPDSRFVQARVDEYPEAYDLDVIRGQITAHVQLLQNWKTRNAHIQIKLYDYPPSFWLVIVDDVLYISVYGKGKLSQEAAVYKFDNRRNSLYHFFHEHFSHVWTAATEVLGPPTDRAGEEG